MKDTFIHHNHLCLVFELLSSNLYELIKQNSFRGLSTSLVRVFTNQLLDALTVLNEAHLIHCDLKPENILLTSLSRSCCNLDRKLPVLTNLLSATQAFIPGDQSHRFWLCLSWTSNRLHLHSIQVLPLTRSHPGLVWFPTQPTLPMANSLHSFLRSALLVCDRHVVPGLHMCRTVFRSSVVSRNLWI